MRGFVVKNIHNMHQWIRSIFFTFFLLHIPAFSHDHNRGWLVCTFPLLLCIQSGGSSWARGSRAFSRHERKASRWPPGCEEGGNVMGGRDTPSCPTNTKVSPSAPPPPPEESQSSLSSEEAASRMYICHMVGVFTLSLLVLFYFVIV